MSKEMKNEASEFFENNEITPSVEGGIELDEIDCCALDRAFEMSPEITQKLKGIVEDDKVFNTIREMIKGAKESGIKFTSEDKMNMVCSQIAKQELDRLEDIDYKEDLSCIHSVRDHIESLQEIIKKMEPTIH